MLHGNKLRGQFVLVRMKPKRDREKADNWLLLKERDGEARPGSDDAVVERETLSVATGRDMPAIAADADRVWSEKTGEVRTKGPRRAASAGKVRRDRPTVKVSAIAGARRAKAPPKISPQLCSAASQAPAGDDWLHEIKFDGYRMLARLKNGKVELRSRNDLDWTKKFPNWRRRWRGCRRKSRCSMAKSSTSPKAASPASRRYRAICRRERLRALSIWRSISFSSTAGI